MSEIIVHSEPRPTWSTPAGGLDALDTTRENLRLRETLAVLVDVVAAAEILLAAAKRQPYLVDVEAMPEWERLNAAVLAWKKASR